MNISSRKLMSKIEFIIFSQRINYDRFSYTKKDYERDPRRQYKSKESNQEDK